MCWECREQDYKDRLKERLNKSDNKMSIEDTLWSVDEISKEEFYTEDERDNTNLL